MPKIGHMVGQTWGQRDDLKTSCLWPWQPQHGGIIMWNTMRTNHFLGLVGAQTKAQRRVRMWRKLANWTKRNIKRKVGLLDVLIENSFLLQLLELLLEIFAVATFSFRRVYKIYKMLTKTQTCSVYDVRKHSRITLKVFFVIQETI